MTIVENILSFTERTNLPDPVTQAGITFLVSRSKRDRARQPETLTAEFARNMSAYPIALNTDAANRQHYEVPAAFFAKSLGARRKYSCCYYESDDTPLDVAEEKALTMTCGYADLQDGQSILELGCGWGSLTLWMAEKYPGSHITAVSNSQSQRDYILSRAKAADLTNVDVITADMNIFETNQRFDRIVSIEMFEHMANWRPLFEKALKWLQPDGRMYIHIFSHRTAPYRFDIGDKSDWIAQHFFTGGIMPSHYLMFEFSDLFEVERDWRWSGIHYARTARDWLNNYDNNSAEIDPILQTVYGPEAQIWKRRWRLFYLATRGLFGHSDGQEWGISHYRLKPRS